MNYPLSVLCCAVEKQAIGLAKTHGVLHTVVDTRMWGPQAIFEIVHYSQILF